MGNRWKKRLALGLCLSTPALAMEPSALRERWSQVLAERVASVQVRAVKAFPTLSVLTAGSPPPNPAELLAQYRSSNGGA